MLILILTLIIWLTLHARAHTYAQAHTNLHDYRPFPTGNCTSSAGPYSFSPAIILQPEDGMHSDSMSSDNERLERLNRMTTLGHNSKNSLARCLSNFQTDTSIDPASGEALVDRLFSAHPRRISNQKSIDSKEDTMPHIINRVAKHHSIRALHKDLLKSLEDQISENRRVDLVIKQHLERHKLDTSKLQPYIKSQSSAQLSHQAAEMKRFIEENPGFSSELQEAGVRVAASSRVDINEVLAQHQVVGFNLRSMRTELGKNIDLLREWSIWVEEHALSCEKTREMIRHTEMDVESVSETNRKLEEEVACLKRKLALEDPEHENVRSKLATTEDSHTGAVLNRKNLGLITETMGEKDKGSNMLFSKAEQSISTSIKKLVILPDTPVTDGRNGRLCTGMRASVSEESTKRITPLHSTRSSKRVKYEIDKSVAFLPDSSVPLDIDLICGRTEIITQSGSTLLASVSLTAYEKANILWGWILPIWDIQDRENTLMTNWLAEKFANGQPLASVVKLIDEHVSRPDNCAPAHPRSCLVTVLNKGDTYSGRADCFCCPACIKATKVLICCWAELIPGVASSFCTKSAQASLVEGQVWNADAKPWTIVFGGRDVRWMLRKRFSWLS